MAMNKERLKQEVLLVDDVKYLSAKVVSSMTDQGLSVLQVGSYAEAWPLLDKDVVGLAVLVASKGEDDIMTFASKMFRDFPDVVMVVLSEQEIFNQNQLMNMGIHSFLHKDMGPKGIAKYLREEADNIASEKEKIREIVNDHSWEAEKGWSDLVEEEWFKTIDQSGFEKW